MLRHGALRNGFRMALFSRRARRHRGGPRLGLHPPGQRHRPGRDHSKPDPEFERKYGLTPRIEHHQIMKRDFLSYIFSGNLWPYGHVTAASIQSIQITTPKLLDFEERVVHAEEHSHHDAILQKIHDYVWEQIG